MTPLQKIDNFYFKREDQNITGSAKDRAITYQIANLQKNNFQSAVISSTGNAAISAQHFCQQANIPLTVFVSNNINQKKLSLITAKTITSQKPISDAIKFSKKHGSYFLRQSTDPSALLGYQQIGQEIIMQLPQVTSVFIPVGSGTTLLGIAQSLPQNIKVFAVQSEHNPSITSRFDSRDFSPTTNLTDALTVRYLPLKNKIIEVITKSQGSGITISNSDLLQSQHWLQNHELNVSPETALTLAGAQYAQTKFDIGQHPLIIVTGTAR